MSTTADELAIRNLVARYIDAVNRYDEDAWAATWADEGTWDLLGFAVSGRDEIVKFWLNAMSSFEFAIMMLNSGTVEVDGDSASGRWYITEHTKPAEGDAAMVLGVYDDRYIREDGEWRFAERRYHIIYQGSADYSGNFNPFRPS